MKSKNKRNALRSLVMSTVLVTSVAVSTVPVSAANAELPIAQYVSASGDAQCGTSPETATYTGKVTLKVPLTKIMEANEANMKLAADNGAYPWNKEKTGIAYITYDVTFPEEVQFGNISATETSSFINKVEATTKNNKQVSLKMTFNDVNWEGIYGLYIADKLDPSAHTVDVEIPYTITANSLAEATKYENELITGTGDFTFYTGRSFFSVKTTYNADTLSKPFVSGLSDCFVPAVQPTAQPTAQPAAQPVAQPAAQPTAQPAAQPTAQPATPAQNAGSSANLEGDILIGNDTQHDKVYEANKTDVLDITGALNVKPIKDELKRLEAQYSAAVAGGISVEDIDTSFTASITLPEGMEYTSSTPQAVLEGANGKFEIVSTSLVGKTATVKLSLKDANQITTYQQLSNAVNSVEDTLKVTVKGVKFSATSSPETEYTINGSVRGDFSGKATNIAGGQVINFNYTWAGKQTQAGADFRALNSENIQFTLKYKKDPTPNPNPNPTNPDTGRIGGKDRIDTAIKISKDNYDKAKTVIVVRHDLFPDSMTASVLAKLKDAPILLNPTDKLDSRVGDEIKRLGAEEVIIVGGQNSVYEKVREDLKAYDADKNVERISGVDRYGTSEMVAKRVTGITGKKHTGVVASGQVFPDALSVGTFASREGYPILLVKKDSVPSQVERAIKDLEINKTYIAGGTNTISKSTETKLPSVLERMAGKDRYETSVAIAKSKFGASKEAYVASGIEFADALVISPISGKYNRPTLLVSNKVNSNQLVRDYVKGSNINKLIAIGGERYVPSSVIDNLVK